MNYDFNRHALVPSVCFSISLYSSCALTHKKLIDWTIIGSDGFSPVRRQAIIPTNSDLLLMEPLHTNVCEIRTKHSNWFIQEK